MLWRECQVCWIEVSCKASSILNWLWKPKLATLNAGALLLSQTVAFCASAVPLEPVETRIKEILRVLLLLIRKAGRMCRVWATVSIRIMGCDMLRPKLHKRRLRFWCRHVSHWGIWNPTNTMGMTTPTQLLFKLMPVVFIF